MWPMITVASLNPSVTGHRTPTSSFLPFPLFFFLPRSLTLETLIHARNFLNTPKSFLKSVTSVTIMVSKYLIKKKLIKYLFVI